LQPQVHLPSTLLFRHLLRRYGGFKRNFCVDVKLVAVDPAGSAANAILRAVGPRNVVRLFDEVTNGDIVHLKFACRSHRTQRVALRRPDGGYVEREWRGVCMQDLCIESEIGWAAGHER